MRRFASSFLANVSKNMKIMKTRRVEVTRKRWISQFLVCIKCIGMGMSRTNCTCYGHGHRCLSVQAMAIPYNWEVLPFRRMLPSCGCRSRELAGRRIWNWLIASGVMVFCNDKSQCFVVCPATRFDKQCTHIASRPQNRTKIWSACKPPIKPTICT